MNKSKLYLKMIISLLICIITAYLCFKVYGQWLEIIRIISLTSGFIFFAYFAERFLTKEGIYEFRNTKTHDKSTRNH